MPTEITDLAFSSSPSPPPPPPPPLTPWSFNNNAPKILDFSTGSVKPCFSNSNVYYYSNPQQATSIWPSLVSNGNANVNQYSQTVAMFPPNMPGGQVAIMIESPPAAAADSGVMISFPNPSRVEEISWTLKEQQLFLMGLDKYGKGSWGKISENLLGNKTPQQVESYAANFFKHMPNAHPYDYWRRNLTYSASDGCIMIQNNNNQQQLLGAPPSSSVVAPPNYYNNLPKEAPKTLSLFPEKAAPLSCPPMGEAGGSSGNSSAVTNTTTHDGASSSSASTVAAVSGGNGEEVDDMELRLGYY